MSYAGDVSPRETYAALERDPQAVLVDVRTIAEWNYVGLPDLTKLGRRPITIEWQTWPDGTVNDGFVTELERAGVGRDRPIYLLCRSGARSRSAAELLTAHGWKAAYNIADGFEGPPDPARHRGHVAGWKHDGLPWIQG